MKPYYEHAGITIYHGDCREILPHIQADVMVTDPPYPNGSGHFVEAIEAAESVLLRFAGEHCLVFWDELAPPPVVLPLVAVHVWHRTNTNRPDNYEAIYEFHRDGRKRASRVMAHAVIAVGLTGCHEATGHPTQKNTRLMRELLLRTEGSVVDPFMGSGTTLRAAKDLGRQAIGIDVEERWCEVAAKRLRQEVLPLGA